MACRLLLSRARTLARLIPPAHIPHSGGIGFSGALSNGRPDLFGVTVGHGLLPRWSRSVMTKPQPEPLDVTNPKEAASFWLTGRGLRRIALYAYFGVLLWLTADMKSSYEDEISDLQTTIKLQTEQNKLLEGRLAEMTNKKTKNA